MLAPNSYKSAEKIRFPHSGIKKLIKDMIKPPLLTISFAAFNKNHFIKNNKFENILIFFISVDLICYD